MTVHIDTEDLDWSEAFEVRCPVYWSKADHSKCETCGGRGRVLSELGERLVAFLHDRYGLELKKEGS